MLDLDSMPPSSETRGDDSSINGAHRHERPLDGLMVVALEHAVAAPFATRQLADLGARVIKIERPDGGDFARAYDHTVHGESSYFTWLNRGKQSAALDLKEPSDLALFKCLVSESDVLVHNLAPGAMDRLGCSPAALARDHERLVICGISGYGEGGPYEQKKAYDLLIQCEAGLLSLTGTEAEPAKVGISIADIAAGMYAYSGILSALLNRTKTGRGDVLHVSMLEALGEWMMQPYLFTHHGGRSPGRHGSAHASIAPYGPFRVGDSGTIFMGIQNDREWRQFCDTVLGTPSLAHDPRFKSNVDRVAHREALTRYIEESWRPAAVDVVAAQLDDLGIASAQLRSMDEFSAHPQLTARGRWTDVETPAGTARSLLPPVQAKDWTAAMGPVPRLGQDTDAIRKEFES